MISGDQNPEVGKETVYSIFPVGLNTTIPNPLSPISAEKAHWEILVLEKRRWRKTGGNTKFGDTVAFNFKQSSTVRDGLKIIVTRGSDKGELIIKPKRAGVPKVNSVTLFDRNYHKVTQPLHYSDTIIARASCTDMEGEKVYFTLWEDDAIGSGHNQTNEINKINAIPLSCIVMDGKAEVKFNMSLYTMASRIADMQVAKGDKNEGKNHEYYVTVDYYGKIAGESKNVNVHNPSDNPIQRAIDYKYPERIPPKPQQPNKRPVQAPVKPAKDTFKVPVTAGAKTKAQDTKGKILSAHFVNAAQQPIKDLRVGIPFFAKIRSSGLKGKTVQLRLYEDDNAFDDLVHEQNVILTSDVCSVSITLTDKIRSEGGDTFGQQYYLEIKYSAQSVDSSVLNLRDDALLTKIKNGASTVGVKKVEKQKVVEKCVCQEQYKDLVWGNKVSCEFRKKVVKICAELWGESRKMEMANELMSCMALETQHSFSSSTGYPNATGLVQFTNGKYGAITAMNETGYNGGKNITKEYLKSLTSVEQLDYVKLYFKMWIQKYKKNIKDSLDMYMTIWCPSAVGQLDSFVCYSKERDKKNGNDFYEKNKSAEYEYYDENEKVIIARLKKDSNKANGEITKGELRPRLKYWKELGINNKNKTFSCVNSNEDVIINEEIVDTGYYIYRDGSIKYIQATKSINYYVQTKKGSNEFKKISTLDKNDFGVVKFPSSGQGFNRYGGIDKGGKSKVETVGEGDHYLKPETAAALFGIINEINDDKWEIHFGDMSSSNGSDPWQLGSKHHAGHGHLGKQSGQNIDFRYLNKSGISFHGLNTSNNFDKDKNQKLYAIANKYGFQKNYASGMSEYRKYGVNPNVGGHYDHGHLGLNNIKLEIVKSINVKIIK